MAAGEAPFSGRQVLQHRMPHGNDAGRGANAGFAHEVAHVMALGIGHQGHHRSRSTGSCGPSGPVQVRLVFGRRIGMHDE